MMDGNENNQVQNFRANISKNAAAAKASGRNLAFYLETVIVVLLLFLVMGVMLRFFGTTFTMTEQAENEMYNTTTARQVAELFQSADTRDELAERIGGQVDATGQVTAQVEYVAGVPMDVSIAIEDEAVDAGTLTRATIVVQRPVDGATPYTLHTTHYIAQGGGAR